MGDTPRSVDVMAFQFHVLDSQGGEETKEEATGIPFNSMFWIQLLLAALIAERYALLSIPCFGFNVYKFY